MKRLRLLAAGLVAALLAAVPATSFADEPQGIIVGDNSAQPAAFIGEPAVASDDGVSLQWSSAQSDDYCYIEGDFDYDEAKLQKELVNQERAANGSPTLVMDKDLQAAAMQRAAELALYYDHTRPNNTSCFTVIDSARAENIAMGIYGSAGSAEDVTELWMNSSGHRANILDKGYTTIGVGCFRISSVAYWCQLFGTGNGSETFAGSGVQAGDAKVDYSYDFVSLEGSGFNLNMAQETPEPLKPSETYELSVGIINAGWTGSRGIYAPTANRGYTWTSSDTSAFTVKNGIVSVSPGAQAGDIATITATSPGGKSWSKAFIVKEEIIAATGVSLDKTALTMDEGDTAALTATVRPANATNKDVSWSSSNTDVATVDAQGNVRAVGSGTAVITVKTDDGGHTAICTVKVSSDTTVTGVTLSVPSVSLDKGSTFRLTCTIAPANAQNKKVSWQSSNTKVATVSQDGIVTAVAPGTAVVTVTTDDGGKTASCMVTVQETTVTGVALDKTELKLKEGESYTLKATVTPDDAKNKKVAWQSSDVKVATVDASGKVTAVAPGTATITVATEDGGKTATCAVKVGDKLTVTFETNGGSAIKSQTVDEGELVQRPTDPTRAYYRFTGWYTDASLKTAYDFTKPVENDLTLYAGWSGYSPYRGFTDVLSSDWYVTGGLFDYALDHGFMNGYAGTTLFGPYDTITRGQVVCVLWNMAGKPSTGAVEDFADNRDPNAYYYEAVRWARSVGVANGYAGTSQFNPNGNVSRQELATFLYNYASKVAGLNVSSNMAAASKIAGWNSVDAYAKPAIAWAVDQGLMSGVDTASGPQLRPHDTAWRASMATMSATFHRNVIGG